VLGAFYLVNAEIGGLGAPLFAQTVGLATAFAWIGIAFAVLSVGVLVVGRRLYAGVDRTSGAVTGYLSPA
jgi:membrane protein implicated in regulation of membrane protease activity